jgi:hypothetical protein
VSSLLDACAAVAARLSESSAEERAAGEAPGPLSVLYGGAQLFGDGSFAKLGALAAKTFDTYVHTAHDMREATGLPLGDELALDVRARVAEKLATSPLEDVRIDFEDGYGVRSEEDEDRDADRVGAVLAKGQPGTPRFCGIRTKAFDAKTGARAARTLARVFEKLDPRTLPETFSVTLPKVRTAEEVARFCDVIDLAERAASLPEGRVRLELMLETPDAVVDEDGALTLPKLVRAGRGRVDSVHLGAYDLLSLAGVAANAQSLENPLYTHVRALLALSARTRGVRLVDGATTRLPLPLHKGEAPSDAQRAENARHVRAALAAHAKNVTSALAYGLHQGWDLHPAQLCARYAAVGAFYTEALAASKARLSSFVERAARATASGQTFDDAATAQGLVVFFARGLASGLLRASDLDGSGLLPSELDALRLADFAALVARRERDQARARG